MIIAHRGVSFTLPENSIPAFEASWEFGIDGIEGDFHLTKDGEIVCIHDDDTERVCKTKVIIHKSTLQDLKKLELFHEADSSLNIKIPTLAEVIKTLPKGKKIFIEIKCGDEITSALLNQLSNFDISSDQIVIISFDSKVIKKIKSGSAKNPIITKKRNDNRLSALRSLIDKEPKIRITIPITIKLMTKAKVSNICIVSELKLDPTASAIKKVLK